MYEAVGIYPDTSYLVINLSINQSINLSVGTLVSTYQLNPKPRDASARQKLIIDFVRISWLFYLFF